LPAESASVVAAPAVPVAVKLTGEPARPALVAESRLLPAAVPRVQLPTVAMPLALVVAPSPVALPPPKVTAKVTPTPLTALPLTSVTFTLGATATLLPAVALWPLPPLMAMATAAPAVTATLDEVAAVREPEVKRMG